MRWPPNKAWTSSSLRQGYRHFVAINYGGKGKDRWVILVSELDGNIRLKVLWDEMKDPANWITGWLQLPKDQSIDISEEKSIIEAEEIFSLGACLHPSEDSGLRIPSSIHSIRPWFQEEENNS